MAGHSKWANIRHRKSVQDARKGKIFTKLIREITVAARTGGGELADNPRLRAAVDKALAANMSKDTIERAIKRGMGGEDGANMESNTYEGYGIGGVAVLVETLTDNLNRTVSEVRHAFTKYGGNLGTSGSVAFQFEKRGEVSLSSGLDDDAIVELVIDAGAQDVEIDENGMLIITAADQSFMDVVDALRATGVEPVSASLTLHAATKVMLDDEQLDKVMKMIELLEDLDDVQEVHTNLELTNEQALRLG